MASNLQPHAFSRRGFLKAATATAAISALPAGRSRAAATHTRKSLQGSNAGRDLENYKIAVRAMLALPPTDPRNWYRNAFTHLLDCPHGNWWFLVWHRGYLGWLERTCRELCGDDTFALPYWDWTQETKIPDAFLADILDPSAPEYVPDVAAFESEFQAPLKAYWDSFDDEQVHQQKIRGALAGTYSDFDEFWLYAKEHFPRGAARARTELTIQAQAAVREQTIRNLLAPREFTGTPTPLGFESVMASSHHEESRDQSILESQPHNNVHGSIGGYMGAFLSPTDPIFFMHHCNIDRLWDVWTRKQQAAGRPIGPEGQAEAAYRAEKFLFFSDEGGDPAPQTTAGDYFDMAAFGYDYEPGTGEAFVVGPLVAAAAAPRIAPVSATVAETFGIGRAATATVAMPAPLTAALAATTGVENFARITIVPPPNPEGLVFDVYVAGRGQPVELTPDSPNYAGSFSFFGHVHHAHLPTTFAIGITDALERLRESGELAPGEEIDVSVSASRIDGEAPLTAAEAEAEGLLTMVQIGAF